MRHVFCASVIMFASSWLVPAKAQVTIALRFDSPHSESTVSEMKREIQTLMRDSGVQLNWRNVSDLSSADAFPTLVVVTFHGSCEVKPLAPPLPHEPVTLAYTHISGGKVIPFAEVECDRVRSSLRSAHADSESGSDLLLGRALGRVLAHELHHILSRTRAHSQQGVFRKSLSPQDLIADRT